MLQKVSGVLLLSTGLCLTAQWLAGWHAHACEHDPAVSDVTRTHSHRVSCGL